MGLDMTLSKKTYVKNWEHMKPEEKVQVKLSGNEKKIKGINIDKITNIEEEVMYWRKANQIHNWFINNCADGDGGRTEMYVSQDQIKELYDTCQKVLAGSKLVKGKIKNGSHTENGKWVDNLEDGEYIEDSSLAEELLPTTRGFFFGSTDYDQYYIEDLKRTVEVLKPIVENMEDDYGDYYYSASW